MKKKALIGNFRRLVLALSICVPLLSCSGSSSSPTTSSSQQKSQNPFATIHYQDLTLNYYEKYGGYAIEDYKGSLSSLALPASITDENGKAFPVTRIQNSAFYGRVSIKEVEIPSSIVSIGDEAFAGTSLTTLYVTGSIREVGANLFANTPYQETIENGAYYLPSRTSSHSVLYKVKLAAKGATFSLPADVESITTPLNDFKFEGALDLSHAVTICDHAFKEADVTSISFGQNLRYIGSHAFAGCANLSEITLPEGTKEIGEYAFYECENVKKFSLPSSLQKMGPGLLSAASLEEVRLPFLGFTEEDPTTISSLINVNNRTIGKLTVDRGPICKYACSYATSGTIVDIGSLCLNHVTSIGEKAFASQSALTELSLGDALKTIEPYAFEACFNLSYVYIPASVESIGYTAFGSFSKKNVLTIDCAASSNIYGEDRWYDEQVATVHWGVAEARDGWLGNFQFATDDNGATLTGYNGTSSSVEVPATYRGLPVKRIAAQVFDAHSEILHLTIHCADIDTRAFAGLINLISLTIEYDYPADAKIDNAAEWFSGSKVANSTQYSKTYFSEGKASYTVMGYVPNSFTTLIVHNNVDFLFGIGQDCFNAVFPHFSTLELSGYGFDLGYHAFSGTIHSPLGGSVYLSPRCLTSASFFGEYIEIKFLVDLSRDITRFELSGFEVSVNSYHSPTGFQYQKDGQGGAVICGYEGEDNTLTIPSSIDGLNVIGIAPYSFDGVVVESLYLPNDQIELERHCLGQIKGLKKLTLAVAIPYIGDIFSALYYEGSNLVSYPTKNLHGQKTNTFAYVPTALETVVIEKGIIVNPWDPMGQEKIPSQCLLALQYTKHIILPLNLSILEEDNFTDFYYLTDIYIPASVTSLPKNVFKGLSTSSAVIYTGLPASSYYSSWGRAKDYFVFDCTYESYLQQIGQI